MRDTHHRIPPLPCLCASVRRASRTLTQLYDAALRPAGLRATQFTILQVLAKVGETSQGELGHALSMDSTTLTRTLRLLRQKGWIALRPSHDRRERRLVLAESGRTQMQRAWPLWEKAQRRVRARLGARDWPALSKLLTEVATTFTY